MTQSDDIPAELKAKYEKVLKSKDKSGSAQGREISKESKRRLKSMDNGSRRIFRRKSGI